MSVLTQRQSGAKQQQSRGGETPVKSRRQPYLVINGATMVAIAAIALTVIGILYLIQTSEVAQLGYDMTRLQTQRDALTLEISELEYELARYESLQTVEQVAVTRLGMATMTNYEFLRIQEPVERNVAIVEPVESESASILERVFDALVGAGSATSEPADLSKYSLDER